MVYMAEGNFSLYTFLIEIDQFVVALPLGLATSVQGELDRSEEHTSELQSP